MKSKRLTTSMRDKITAAVVDDALKARREQHQLHRAQLADEVYASVVGEHEATMKRLPTGYCDVSRALRVEVIESGQHGRRYHLGLSDDRLFPAFARFHALLEARSGSEIAERLAQLEVEKENIDKDAEGLREKVIQVVHSVSTVAKLIEVWPEVKPYLPPEATQEDAVNLPAIVVADLNQVLAQAKAA